MNKLDKYPFIAVIAARSNLAYFGDVASRFIFLGVILYIFMRLWQVTYAETGAQILGGLTLGQMLWYLAITESIQLSGPRVAQSVDEDVRTGSLAVQLVRPVSYPLYRLCTTLGERSVRFSMNALVAVVIAWLLVGPIQTDPLGLAIFMMSLPLAFVLDFLGNFLVGLGAFWLEDTTGLLLIYSRLSMILGGMLLPLDLFPAYLKPFLEALPFASIVYGPARLFVHPDPAYLVELIARQGLAILVVGLLVAYVYRIALKRVHAHGG